MTVFEDLEITDELFITLSHNKQPEGKPITIGKAVGYLIRGYLVQTPDEAGLIVDEFTSSLSEKNKLLLELFGDPDLELIVVSRFMNPWYVDIESWDKPKYHDGTVPTWRTSECSRRFQNHRPRGKLSDLENVESIWANEAVCRKHINEWETRWVAVGRR